MAAQAGRLKSVGATSLLLRCLAGTNAVACPAFATGGEVLVDDLKQNPVSEAVSDAAAATQQQAQKMFGGQQSTTPEGESS